MKKLYHSFKVLFEQKKTPDAYVRLYYNNYIYKWSSVLCLKKFY